jgi:hypothetical protein
LIPEIADNAIPVANGLDVLLARQPSLVPGYLSADFFFPTVSSGRGPETPSFRHHSITFSSHSRISLRFAISITIK